MFVFFTNTLRMLSFAKLCSLYLVFFKMNFLFALCIRKKTSLKSVIYVVCYQNILAILNYLYKSYVNYI